jgi:hypothetical protein
LAGEWQRKPVLSGEYLLGQADPCVGMSGKCRIGGGVPIRRYSFEIDKQLGMVLH